MDLAFWQKQPILITVNNQTATVEKAIDQLITENKVAALMSDIGSEFTNDKVEKLKVS